MKQTREVGLIGEAKVLAKFLELGYIVSIPFGGCARYDFIIERDKSLVKIQVKTRALQDTFIRVDLVSSSNKKRYIEDDANELWVYCPDNDSIYRLDLRKVKNKRGITLRVKKNKVSDPASHNAIDFLVE